MQPQKQERLSRLCSETYHTICSNCENGRRTRSYVPSPLGSPIVKHPLHTCTPYRDAGIAVCFYCALLL